ncbi:MAG: hypothetical protein CMJ49_10700 [Planctomycetaceae bacterium]|nr:hypothetical protein [Planctomycetaceae bacterium]
MRRAYPALAEFHYLRHRPVTAVRVLVLEDVRPTVIGRYTQQRRQRHVIALLVESFPALNCALRNHALGERYRGWRDRRTGARLLNAELRCISRVIVHPQWRGLGLAVRLVREALDTMTTPYTEALAAMGRVHPFFARAGMTEYRRWPHARDQRLLDALRYADIASWHLANVSDMQQRLARGASSLPPPTRLLRAELARWAGRQLTLHEQLTRARDHLLCEPVYYLKGQDT